MKRVLIAGITGVVGEGLATYFLANNFNVTAVVRNEQKKAQVLDALKELSFDASRLNFIINSFSNDAEVELLVHKLKIEDKIDLAIASLGGWYHGNDTAQLPQKEWNEYVQQSLSSHFYFAKVCMQYFKQNSGGSYVMINGGASEYAVPHSGVISIMAAAQKMLTQVLHKENKKYNINVIGVAAFQVVRTKKTSQFEDLWLTTDLLAKYIKEAVFEGKFSKKGYWHKIAASEDIN
jgi:NAD(P)-dependent dehydrogenase (short-subunit alcohol dehydrogenase family)